MSSYLEDTTLVILQNRHGVRMAYGWRTDRVRLVYGWCTDIVRILYVWCTSRPALVLLYPSKPVRCASMPGRLARGNVKPAGRSAPITPSPCRQTLERPPLGLTRWGEGG